MKIHFGVTIERDAEGQPSRCEAILGRPVRRGEYPAVGGATGAVFSERVLSIAKCPTCLDSGSLNRNAYPPPWIRAFTTCGRAIFNPSSVNVPVVCCVQAFAFCQTVSLRAASRNSWPL